MPEVSLDDAFTRLLNTLHESGLDWVREQILDYLRQGPDVDESGTSEKASHRVQTRPFSADDRVRIAISAVRIAIVDTAALQEEVGRYFTGDAASPANISFRDEASSDSTPPALTPSLPARRRDLNELQGLLNEIERQVLHGE